MNACDCNVTSNYCLLKFWPPSSRYRLATCQYHRLSHDYLQICTTTTVVTWTPRVCDYCHTSNATLQSNSTAPSCSKNCRLGCYVFTPYWWAVSTSFTDVKKLTCLNKASNFIYFDRKSVVRRTGVTLV